MQSITIKLESFEGPFELLFHLIERNKIDIYDIPIAQLTDQYVEHIESLEKKDMETMSEFILMAASLIEIKSKMLLPKPVNENDEDIDPREELVNRLIEYKKFKKIAEILNGKQFDTEQIVFKNPDRTIISMVKQNVPKSINDILNGADLDMLYKVFEDVLKRQEVKTDKIRSKFNSVSKDLFTIQDKIQYITDLLKINNKVSFSKMFRKDVSKIEVVVTFLAMLELIKVKKIFVKQNILFDDIVITGYEER